jgi:hypothetical protein
MIRSLASGYPLPVTDLEADILETLTAPTVRSQDEKGR